MIMGRCVPVQQRALRWLQHGPASYLACEKIPYSVTISLLLLLFSEILRSAKQEENLHLQKKELSRNGHEQ
jgi:hypothetical protein